MFLFLHPDLFFSPFFPFCSPFSFPVSHFPPSVSLSLFTLPLFSPTMLYLPFSLADFYERQHLKAVLSLYVKTWIVILILGIGQCLHCYTFFIFILSYLPLFVDLFCQSLSLVPCFWSSSPSTKLHFGTFNNSTSSNFSDAFFLLGFLML